jgi:hypothetical protein
VTAAKELKLGDRFRETELMDLPFGFPWNRIGAIGEFWETKSKARSDGWIGKRTAAKEARNKVRRTALKSHETAKSEISRPNDFNSL